MNENDSVGGFATNEVISSIEEVSISNQHLFKQAIEALDRVSMFKLFREQN